MEGHGEIQTFVFLDTEATGLQNTRPRITELSLVAVHREGLQQAAIGLALPRILNKLTLCFYPMKAISPRSSDITGKIGGKKTWVILKHAKYTTFPGIGIPIFMIL